MMRVHKSTVLESDKQTFRVELRVADEDETRFITLLQTNSAIDPAQKSKAFKSPKSGGRTIDAMITPMSPKKAMKVAFTS